MPSHLALLGRLLAGTALMTAAMAIAGAAGSLAAADRLGTGWGGLPNALGVAGTALGAAVLTRVGTARDRAAGLRLGYGVAAVGCCLAVLAVAGGPLVLLLAGMGLAGIGNAGAQLSRYAATDLYPAHRWGFAMGTTVWAGTVGAVGGPLLLGPAGAVATAHGRPALAGAFVPAALCAAGAAVALVGRWPRPAAVAVDAGATVAGRHPSVRAGEALMLTAFLVMSLVMTAMPVGMHRHGAGLGAVGLVLSAHTLGMFGLAPVVGRLCDRVGPRPVGLAGLAVLAVAAGSVPGAAPETAVLTVVLFLVGLGWNLCLMAGSTLLARDLPAAAAVRVQGRVETVVWAGTAVATLASTAIYALGGTGWLAALCVLLTMCAVPLTAQRTRPNLVW
jgi:MFS family permease